MKIIPRFDITTRKSDVLAAILLFGVGAIIVQLFIIQVVQHERYKKQAFLEQVAKFTLPATRGQIYARDGSETVPLVLNQPVYTAFADPQQVKDQRELEDSIKKIAGGTLAEGYREGLKSKTLRYVVLARQLSHAQAELLKEENIPGVGLTETSQRVYPEGNLASQLLGYVDREGNGQYGIEGALNTRLKGKSGVLQAVTDVRRIPLTIGRDDVSVPAQNGDNLVLSIDRSIQSYAEIALKKGLEKVRATKGSVVVMDPTNGQILAMANHPTYNPAEFNKVQDYAVFQNPVVSEPYEAGSVIKTLSMGVGLDTGAVNTGTTFNNRGYVQIDDTKISNVEEDPINPRATMLDVLHYSLNTGVVFVLQQMGGGRINQQARNQLYDYYYNHYRFGRPTGVEQTGDSEGILIAPDKEQGNNVRYANMAFGQGMDVTMLQTAAAFSAAINGGTYYQPTMVGGITLDGRSVKPKAPRLVKADVLKPAVSTTLRDMIVEGRQLGALGGKDRAGFTVGGKTGTSQIIDPRTGKYTNDNSIGSYLGFGGNAAPHYVIMVQVKDSKAPGYSGTTAAGPIFTDISNWLLDYMKIPPTT